MNELNPNWDVSAETMGELMAKNWQQAVTINELQAQIYRIRDAYYNGKGGDGMDALGYAIMETEAVNMAAIQAEAIEKAVREVRQQIPADNEFGSVDACYTYKLINYAADIRQQADKG